MVDIVTGRAVQGDRRIIGHKKVYDFHVSSVRKYSYVQHKNVLEYQGRFIHRLRPSGKYMEQLLQHLKTLHLPYKKSYNHHRSVPETELSDWFFSGDWLKSVCSRNFLYTVRRWNLVSVTPSAMRSVWIRYNHKQARARNTNEELFRNYKSSIHEHKLFKKHVNAFEEKK